MAAPRTARRVALLAACALAGAAGGALGAHWSGSQAWWLCVPAVVALGWLAVADPTRCDPQAAGRAAGLQRDRLE